MSGKTPDALLSRPKLLTHQSFYLDIFFTLAAWRGYRADGSPSPIELKDVLVYCELFELDSPEFRSTLLAHIKRLDIAYLRSRAKQAEDSRKDTEPAPAT